MRRIIALFVILCMLLSIQAFAQSSVTTKDILNTSYYELVSDVITSHTDLYDVVNGTVYNSAGTKANDLLTSYSPLCDDILNNIYSDSWFLTAIAGWEIENFLQDAGDNRTSLLNGEFLGDGSTRAYETLLMFMLKTIMRSYDEREKVIKGIENESNDVCILLSKYAEANGKTVNELDDYELSGFADIVSTVLDKWSTHAEIGSQSLSFLEWLGKTHELPMEIATRITALGTNFTTTLGSMVDAGKISAKTGRAFSSMISADAIGKVALTADVIDNFADVYRAWASFNELEDIAISYLDFLDVLLECCNDNVLRQAIRNVSSSLRSLDYRDAYLRQMLKEAALDTAFDILWYAIAEELDAKWLMFDLSLTMLENAFNTGEKIESIYICKNFRDMLLCVQKAYVTCRQRYMRSSSEQDALLCSAAFDVLFEAITEDALYTKQLFENAVTGELGRNLTRVFFKNASDTSSISETAENIDSLQKDMVEARNKFNEIMLSLYKDLIDNDRKEQDVINKQWNNDQNDILEKDYSGTSLLPFDVEWGMNPDEVTGKLPNKNYYFLDNSTDQLTTLHFDEYDENASGVRSGYKYVFMFVDGELRKINTMIYAGGDRPDSELQQYLVDRFGNDCNGLDENDVQAINRRLKEFEMGEEPFTKEELEEDMPSARTWDFEDTTVWANWVWEQGYQTEMATISYLDRNWFYIENAENNNTGNAENYIGTTEDGLKSIAANYGNIVLWHYADYDGNGTCEAFFAIGEEDAWGETELIGEYFIDSSGNVQKMNDYNGTLYVNAYGCAHKCGGKEFFWGSYGYSGPGTWTFVYSVKNGVPYELPSLKALYGSGEGYSGFYENNGIFYVFKDGYLPEGGHDGRNYELIYDAVAQDFYLGKEIDPSKFEEQTGGMSNLENVGGGRDIDPSELSGRWRLIQFSDSGTITEADDFTLYFIFDEDTHILRNEQYGVDDPTELVDGNYTWNLKGSTLYLTDRYGYSDSVEISINGDTLYMEYHEQDGTWGDATFVRDQAYADDPQETVVTPEAQTIPNGRVYSVDIDRDGLPESIEVTYTSTADYNTISYTITSGDGQSMIGGGMERWPHSEVGSWGEIQIRIGVVGNDCLYVEMNIAEVCGYYRVYQLVNNQLVLVEELENPGYSSGEGLYYCTNGDYDYDRPVFYDEDDDDFGRDPGMVAALNGVLNKYDVYFSQGDHPYLANLDSNSLLFDLRESDFSGGRNIAVEPEPIRPDSGSTAYVYLKEDANVRTGAGTNNGVIDVAYAGSQYMYLDESRKDDRSVDWYKISFEGGEGWVSSKLPEIRSGSSAAGQTDASSGTSTGSSPASGSQIITTGKVNVRSGPGTSYEYVDNLGESVRVEYLGESQYDDRPVLWYKIRRGGTVGWISSKYAEFVSGGSVQQDEDEYEYTDEYDWEENVTGGTSGGKVIVSGGDVSMRVGPGVDYQSIDALSEGQTMNYLGQISTDDRGIDWYYVSYKDKVGWVSSKYTRLA